MSLNNKRGGFGHSKSLRGFGGVKTFSHQLLKGDSVPFFFPTSFFSSYI